MLMSNDLEYYLSLLKMGGETNLTREGIVASAIVNVKRIVIELQELENYILAKTNISDLSTLILGAQLETIKRELIKIKQEYQKKW